MKHKKYICLCCNNEAKNARLVDVDNLDNIILCNHCNLQLINKGEIRLTDDVVLRTKGYRGDFIRVVAENNPKEPDIKLNWFEREAIAQHYSNMDTFH